MHQRYPRWSLPLPQTHGLFSGLLGLARRLQHGFSLFEDGTCDFDRRVADYYPQCWGGGILAVALGVILPLLVTATQLGFHTSHMDLICAREHCKPLDQVNEREFGNLPERIIIITFRAVQPTLVALIPLAVKSR
jgi:hypothetical protein